MTFWSPYLSGQPGASGHADGHIGPVSVSVELSGGDGVSQVGVVVLQTALARFVLVAELGQVLGEHLT